MFNLCNKSMVTIIVSLILIISTTATAYDASVSDFEWIYPQIISPDTDEIQYSFRFHLSPHSYSFNCFYNAQLYISSDMTLSNNDFALFDQSELFLPAGAVGFTVTVTRHFYTDISLPASGIYYIFIELTPGIGAPSDTDSSNNVDMAYGTIQVSSTPHVTPILTAATVVTIPGTGQSIIVAGYDNGVLEFRDWQGNRLAMRDDFDEITALAAGIVGSPPTPQLFVASLDSGGTLRVVDLTNIEIDIATRTNLGRVTAIEVCDKTSGAVYIGTSNVLHKLNNMTLSDENVRQGIGNITEITQVPSMNGGILACGSDKLGGSVYFVDKDTLNDVITQCQGFGYVYALSSADIDLDGEAELIVASDDNGGSIQLREGPNFTSSLALQENLGMIYTLDYGHLGTSPYLGSVGNAWILFASDQENGSLNLMRTEIGMSGATFDDREKLINLGTVPYAELHDFYTVGAALVGAIIESPADLELMVLDESLIESDEGSFVTEGFESGDFNQFTWEHSGNANWIVTSQESNSGLYSARAGSIGNSETSVLQVSLQCVSGDITFCRKVSSESFCDNLKFFIDGVEKDRWSCEKDWADESFPVTAGARTFKWVYTKDGSVSRGDDTAWIDDIVFPITGQLLTGADGGSMSSPPNSVGFFEQQPVRIEYIMEYE